MSLFANKTLMITGGTGSFGNAVLNRFLQTDIGEFNLMRINLDAELTKEEKDEEKLKKINEDMRAIYSKIMANESMIKYQTSKKELDGVVDKIYGLILACAAGADPDTAEISDGCSGNCSSCAGCH